MPRFFFSHGKFIKNMLYSLSYDISINNTSYRLVQVNRYLIFVERIRDNIFMLISELFPLTQQQSTSILAMRLQPIEFGMWKRHRYLVAQIMRKKTILEVLPVPILPTIKNRTWYFRPPNGCLQYQTGLTGRITTFNFAATDSQQHLASQSYSHCIRQEAGFCCIQYQVRNVVEKLAWKNVAFS